MVSHKKKWCLEISHLEELSIILREHKMCDLDWITFQTHSPGILQDDDANKVTSHPGTCTVTATDMFDGSKEIMFIQEIYNYISIISYFTLLLNVQL